MLADFVLPLFLCTCSFYTFYYNIFIKNNNGSYSDDSLFNINSWGADMWIVRPAGRGRRRSPFIKEVP